MWYWDVFGCLLGRVSGRGLLCRPVYTWGWFFITCQVLGVPWDFGSLLMGGPSVGSKSTYPGMGRINHASRRKAKALKASAHKPRFTLGIDIFMDRVESLCQRALIGRLEYTTLTKDGWVDWATHHWKPIIHYVPSISLLANNWLVFVFLEESDASLILENLWPVHEGSVILKNWHSGFDPLTERVAVRHL